MRRLPSILLLFRNEFNEFNNMKQALLMGNVPICSERIAQLYDIRVSRYSSELKLDLYLTEYKEITLSCKIMLQAIWKALGPLRSRLDKH